MWLRQKNTYCHVFDVHVSLSLQLGNYLPVEPLKLQERRSGREGGRGSKRQEHMQMIRERTRDGARRAIVVNGRREGERSPPGERSLGLYRRAPAGSSAECELCAYEWVRNKAWERLLRSVLLPLIRGRVGMTAAVAAASLRHNQSVSGGSDGQLERVRPSPTTMSH